MFLDEQSDFLTYLNLWRWIEKLRGELTNSRWQPALRKRFINPMRIEVGEIHRQIKSVCAELGLRANSAAANYQQIHEAPWSARSVKSPSTRSEVSIWARAINACVFSPDRGWRNEH